MRRDEVIARLKEVEPAIRARGARALYLFGSHARDEAGADSDVDVFIDKDRSRQFGFDEFMDIYVLQSTVATAVQARAHCKSIVFGLLKQ